jgi:hypothetical protein
LGSGHLSLCARLFARGPDSSASRHVSTALATLLSEASIDVLKHYIVSNKPVDVHLAAVSSPPTNSRSSTTVT